MAVPENVLSMLKQGKLGQGMLTDDPDDPNAPPSPLAIGQPVSGPPPTGPTPAPPPSVTNSPYVPPWARPSSKTIDSDKQGTNLNIDKSDAQWQQEMEMLKSSPEYAAQNKDIEGVQNLLDVTKGANLAGANVGWVKPLQALTDAWTGSHLAKDYEEPTSQNDVNSQLMQYQSKLAQMRGDQYKELLGGVKDLKAGTQQDIQNKQNMQMMGIMSGRGGQDPDSQQIAKLQQLALSYRGDAASQQAAKDTYAATKAKSLMALYPNMNDMPEAQVHTLVSELGKIASGGAPTLAETEGIMPSVPSAKLSKMLGDLQAKPNAAGLGAYTQELARYNGALAADAQAKLDARQHAIWDPYKDKYAGNPLYQSMRQQFVPEGAAPSGAPDGRITVKDKDGNIGHIPAEQLKDALAEGYSQVK